MKPLLSALCFFICGSTALWAAEPNPKIDSLLRVTREAPHDTLKAEAFVHLVAQHRYERDAALAYARAGITLAKKTSFQRGLYNLYNQMGVVYDVAGEYLPALDAYAQAMEAAQKLKRPELIGSIHTNIGLSLWNLGSYDKALESYLKALPYFENNDKAGVYLANTYNNIGLIYGEKKEYQKSRPYFEKAIANSQSINDSFNLAAYYNNMGNAFRDAAEPEAALNWFAKAAAIHHSLQNNYGLGMVWYNMAGTYQDLEKHGLALETALKSLAVRELAGDRMGIALAHNLLSAVYLSFQKPAKALFHNDAALSLANEIGSTSLWHRIYRNRWEVLLAARQIENALEAHIQYKKYGDSLSLAEADKRLRELEVRYEVDKKDQTIAQSQLLLQQQAVVLTRRNQLIGALGISLVLAVVLGLVLRSRYQYKQQQALTAAKLLMQQSHIKAVIAAQEAEKTRFAQDLHDGIGQLLTALKLSLNPGATATEHKSMALIDELYSEMRHLAYNIMPQTLLKRGLQHALEDLTSRLNQSQSHIGFVFTAFGYDQRLPLASEQLLYRVVQEWLTNLIKYAGCNRVVINLVAADGQLSLMIEDDGQGFDPQTLKESRGHGWSNIESRLGVLDASYEIDSRPGKQGTTFNIAFSIAKPSI